MTSPCPISLSSVFVLDAWPPVLLFSFVFGHQIVELGAVPSTRPHLPRTLAMLSPDLKQWWVGVMQRYIYIINNRFYIDYVILYIDSIDSIT